MNKQNLPSKKLLDEAITSDDLLGKDVLDCDGVLIGVTNKLYIDRDSIEVLGVSVDKGFLRTGLVVGADHVEHVTKHAVFLKIRPAFQIKGMHVFDVDGALVGVVKAVSLTEDYSEIASIQVKPSRWFAKTVEVSGYAIADVGENVFLSLHKNEVL